MIRIEPLRALLRVYKLKRISRSTGITVVTLRRFRDGKSSPTLANYDAIMQSVIDDAIEVHRAPPQPSQGARMP